MFLFGFMRILCDRMLGSLAKWLRIFGVDTFYPLPEMTDDEMLDIAAKEQRLFISRDKELVIRAKKAQVMILELRTTDLDEQLRQVLRHTQVDSEEMLSRCIVCNTPLVSVKKDTVKAHVPPKVFETRIEFWFCPVCDKYYWKGTHYDNMVKKINTLKKETTPTPD
jgi:uncharacterized protein